MHIINIAKREMKTGFRNAWTYAFLLLLTIFTIAILFLQSGISSAEGYTDTMGTMMNMTLYLLPLTTLLLGGFSTTGEKESGQWGLLSTYPITGYAFLIGKWLGLAITLITIIFFSFGIAGTLVSLFGQALAFKNFLFLLLFAVSLALVYLSISIFIGTLAKNRWQALIGGITIWFLTIMMWPVLLISGLSHLPSYQLVQPTLQILTMMNPAEFLRVFFVMRLGGGSAFGANYLEWITMATSKSGIFLFGLFFFAWIVIILFISGFIWSRGENGD